MDSKQTAGHNCSRLFYTEASAWVLPQFVNVTAIKQPLIFLFLNMVVATALLRGKIQIFQAHRAYLPAPKGREEGRVSLSPCSPFPHNASSLQHFCYPCSASLPPSLHVSSALAFGWLVQNLKGIPQIDLRLSWAPGWVRRETGSAQVDMKKQRRLLVWKGQAGRCPLLGISIVFPETGGERTGFTLTLSLGTCPRVFNLLKE